MDYRWSVFLFAGAIRVFFFLCPHIWMGARFDLECFICAHVVSTSFSCCNILWTYTILDRGMANMGAGDCWIDHSLVYINVE